MFASRLAPHLRKLKELKGVVEVVFVDAPLELPKEPGDEVAMRTWWLREAGGGGGRAFEGWEASLRLLRDVWRDKGPFQGVIGFSQGAAVGFLLTLLADAADHEASSSSPDACFASLRSAVLCAGYVPSPLPIRVPGVRPTDGYRVGTAGASRPTLIIAGAGDVAVPPAATWQLAAWFDDHCKHAHKGNHAFPAKAADVAAVVAFINAQAAAIRDEEDDNDNVGGGSSGGLGGGGDGGGGGQPQPPLPLSEELAEEMEALEAIFDEEMTVERGGTTLRLSFTLPGVADALSACSSGGGGGGEHTTVCPTLTLVLPVGYPQEPPTLHPHRALAGMTPRVARALRPGLEAAVAAAAAPLLGGPMVYSVVAEAREWLDGAVADVVAAAAGAGAGASGGEDASQVEVEDAHDDDDVKTSSAAGDVDLDECGDGDGYGDEDDGVHWWDREETDPYLVAAATREALAAESAAAARSGSGGGPVAPVGGAGRWRFTLGLVGKPSAGKSTFFNAATELSEGAAGSARGGTVHVESS